MRKILAFGIILGLLSSPIFALTTGEKKSTATSTMSTVSGEGTPSQLPIINNASQIDYPKGEVFLRLKNIIDTNFSKSEATSNKNCIANSTLCPNYMYTSVVEKAIRLIVLRTYIGNEVFYHKLFINSQSSDKFSEKNSLKKVLRSIPMGTTVMDLGTFGFGNSIEGEFLNSSFGVNFSNSLPSYSVLNVIEEKIKEIKQKNCKKYGETNSDCYQIDISNKYLPTPEELADETIDLVDAPITIGNLKNDIEYSVVGLTENRKILNEFIMTSAGQKGEIPCMQSSVESTKTQCINALKEIKNIEATALIDYLLKHKTYPNTFDQLKNIIPNKSFAIISNNFSLKKISGSGGENYEIRYIGNIGEKTTTENLVRKVSKDNIKESSEIPEPTYILRYKKNTYSLEEARAEIKKIEVSAKKYIITSHSELGQLPCIGSRENNIRSQCLIVVKELNDIKTALSTYYVNKNIYPESLDAIKGVYIQNIPQIFNDNFFYRTTKNASGSADYEIRYIGSIGTSSMGSGEFLYSKDYTSMLSGATVPEIPALFSHVPSDSIVLYVRNPTNLIEILNQKKLTTQELSGIDISENIKVYMSKLFELEKFEQIEKNLKHEMAIVVNNLDATAPDIIIILSESDKNALPATIKARVVGTKDGFIFIANSKESLENIMRITLEESMASAQDFQYTWLKKSTLIKDAFLFIGDEFFTKMLSLETYITHYRKYHDYVHLSSLQELVWAYEDAFGRSPTEISELSATGLLMFTGETLSDYSIIDGIVTNINIGTLKTIKSLPEIHYDLSNISKNEMDSYQYNVFQYREKLKSLLDPVGIIINKYADGVEMNLFITSSSFFGNHLDDVREFFVGTSKNSLSFVTNTNIRMGLLSFVFGFDPKKIQEKLQENTEIGNNFSLLSKQIIDGKNIFDYLGGEFAFSLGNIDSDLFDEWNTEKLDTYISVQVTSEEKGREFIELLKKRVLGGLEYDNTEGNTIMNMIMKPLIEEYKGKKIYYTESIPVPALGKLGIAYTFVDNFCIIGVNRSTIRHIIDTSISGDDRKKNILNADTFSTGTFLSVLFDGKNTSQQIGGLYQKNSSNISKYLKNQMNHQIDFMTLVSGYYTSENRNKRLELHGKSIQYSFGALSLMGKDGNIMVSIDPKKLTSLSGSALEVWEGIKKDPTFPSVLLSDEGISLDKFFSLKYSGDILLVNIAIQTENAISTPDSFFRNITFGMNMDRDEVGFKLRIFREYKTVLGGMNIGGLKNITLPSTNGMIGTIILIGVLLVLCGIIIIFIRRRSKAQGVLDTAIESQLITQEPILPSDDVIVPSTDNISGNENITGDAEVIQKIEATNSSINIPTETIPTETIPTETIPTETIPTETIPMSPSIK